MNSHSGVFNNVDSLLALSVSRGKLIVLHPDHCVKKVKSYPTV